MYKQKFTDNFYYFEMIKSNTATRLGIDNTPSQEHYDNALNLAENVLQPVRDNFGRTVTVSSWYRSPELNAAVRGSATSQHCNGEAADIEIFGLPNATLAEWIRDNCSFDQLILEFYTQGEPNSGWVHVSFKSEGNRHEVLTAAKENGRTVYIPGIHR